MSVHIARRRTLICEAAVLLVQETNAEKLTLDQVAAAADLPLGAVLEQYPDIDSLILDILSELMDTMFGRVVEIQGADDRPGSWLRAYVKAKLPSDGSDNFARLMNALLSSTGFRPGFVESAVDSQREIHGALLSDGVDPSVAFIVRSAVDGLWMAQVFGIDIVPPERLQQTIDELHALIDRGTLHMAAE